MTRDIQAQREQAEKAREVITLAIGELVLQGYHITPSDADRVMHRVAPLPEPELPTVKIGDHGYTRYQNKFWEATRVPHWETVTDETVTALFNLIPSEQRWTLAEMTNLAGELRERYEQNKARDIDNLPMCEAILATFGGAK